MSKKTERVERKLAAIFCADVADYSRLMHADEVQTLRTLTAHRAIMDGLIAQHSATGRIVMPPDNPSTATRSLASIPFTAILISLLAASSVVAENPKVPRLGILAVAPCSEDQGFGAALATHGWREGSTVHIDCVSGSGRLNELPALAAELVSRKPDAVIAWTGAANRALAQATSTVPIVIASPDPVREGYAESLSRPGRNVTGIAAAGLEVVSKRLELLKQLSPTTRTFGVLLRATGGDITYERLLGHELDNGAAAQGLQWRAVRYDKEDELEPVFASMAREGIQAVYVAPTPLNYAFKAQIAAVAVRHALPTVADNRQFVASGALVSYGFDYQETLRQFAAQVDRVLRGARPETLPIERPTRFPLVLNMSTARRLGIEVSATVLARADEVIE